MDEKVLVDGKTVEQSDADLTLVTVQVDVTGVG
jgi:hypothetical protein